MCIRDRVNRTLHYGDGSTATTNKWAGLISRSSIATLCPTIPLPMFYHQISAKVVQGMGASALIFVSEKALSDPYTAPPGVDAEERIVDGTVINIATIVLQETPELSTLLLTNNDDLYWLESASLLETDVNVLTELVAPWSWYRIVFGMLLLWAIYMIVLVMKGIKDEHDFTVEEQTASSRRVATMRYLILVPELVKNILAVIFLINPLDLFFMIDYFTSRMIMATVASIGTFTNAAMCFYW